MAAHRYWRAVLLDARVLELSEVRLLGVGSEPLTLTEVADCNRVPITGTLADLWDDDTSTGCTLQGPVTFTWDFSVGQEVSDMQFGSAGGLGTWPQIALLESSDDGEAWTSEFSAAGLKYPGRQALTASTLWVPSMLLDSQQREPTPGITIWLDGDVPLRSAAGTRFWDSKGYLQPFSPSQPVSNSQPATVTEVINGRSVVRFDGANDELDVLSVEAGNLFRNVTDGWMFVVARRRSEDSVGTRRVLFGTLNPSAQYRWGIQFGWEGDGVNKHAVVARRLDAEASTVTYGLTVGTDWFIRRGHMSWGANRYVDHLNGEVQIDVAPLVGAGPTSDTASNQNWFAIGGVNNGFCDMDLACLMVGSGPYVPADADFQRLEGWAAHYYALQANLPPGHPYAEHPPLRIESTGYVAIPEKPTTVESLGATPLPVEARPTSNLRARPNFFFDPNARGRIVGTVKRKDTPANVPLARRVRLYRDRDGMLISETWSDANGDYVFEWIEEGEAYTTLAHDYTHFHRAVAADNLTLANGSVELM